MIRLRPRRTVWLAALAAIITMGALGLAVPAAQAQPGASGDICWAPTSTGTTYCWSLHVDSGVAGYVYANTGPGRASSALTEDLDGAACNGGYVTDSCPFTNTDLDRVLVGHAIINIFFSSGSCMAAQSNYLLYGAACSAGSNQAYVLTNNDHGFVTVGGSNLLGAASVVCMGLYNSTIFWSLQTECSGSYSVWYLRNP
jgi:hypothetical protein